MKKIIVFLSFVFLSNCATAQINTSIDWVGSADYSGLSKSFFADFHFRFNYRIGANFNFRIFDKIKIKTGVRYTELGFVLKSNDLRWPSEITSDGWVPDPTLPRFIHRDINKRFIEIPVIARYEFGEKRLSFFGEFGFSPHFYINTKEVETTNLEESSEVFDEVGMGQKRMQVATVIAFGANYSLSDEYQFFLQPTLRYYLGETVYDTTSRAQSIGLEFGLRRVLSREAK